MPTSPLFPLRFPKVGVMVLVGLLGLSAAGVPARAEPPPAGPMPNNGAEKIFVLSTDRGVRLPGADQFPERDGDMHRLVFRLGFALSVPHLSEEAVPTAAQRRALCTAFLGRSWSESSGAADIVLGGAPVTADGAVWLEECPTNSSESRTVLAARNTEGVWVPVGAVSSDRIKTYNPATHTALALAEMTPTARGVIGAGNQLLQSGASEYIRLLLEADDAIKAKLPGARLDLYRSARAVAEGPGWLHAILVTRITDPGTGSLPRGTFLDIHVRADAFAPGFDRYVLDLKGGGEPGFYPSASPAALTLHGPWSRFDAPVAAVEAPLPLFPGAAPAAPPPAAPEMLVSRGTTAPAFMIPRPGAGPAMTLDTATALFHGWIDAQPLVSAEGKRRKADMMGSAYVAKGFVPLDAEGGLVLISTTNFQYANPYYFLAVRTDGAWRIVAQRIVGNGLLTWDRERRTGFASSDNKVLLDDAARLSLQRTVNRFAVEWGTQTTAGLDGLAGSVRWTGIADDKPINGVFRLRLTNPAANLWRLQPDDAQ